MISLNTIFNNNTKKKNNSKNKNLTLLILF
jgi:hypothetical protein